MALNDFIKLADDKLHEVFSRKPHDPSKARNAAIKRLDTTHNQFIATEPARGRKMFKIQNGVVELTLPWAVGGKSVFHIPSERFADAISHLKESISKGELDKELETANSSNQPATARSGQPRKKREWSHEQRDAFAASIKARQAAKQAG